MITPQFITLDGRPGTVVYLDADWHPVTPEQATMAQVLFDDGGTAFYQTAVHTSAQKFDPEERRDAKGRWTKGGKAGLLTTDDVDEQIAHITRQRAYAHYGVRVDNNPSLKVGQVAPVSSDWSEDDHPKTLEGTAAVIVRDWTRVINYSGSQIVLMGSAEAHPGTDKNEIVMPDAVVLGIWPTPVWGPTKRRAKAEGIGGITKKFDEALHPRGEDGRFIEATSPRIFNTPADVGQYNDWGKPRWAWIDKETGKPGGALLTGEPLARDTLPETLYHVTTAGSAVASSGVLLGLLGDGGLGGGQAPGVSFTTSREDATVIQRELRRAVLIARGEDSGLAAIERYAHEDEQEAGLSAGTLKDAVEFARYNWHDPTEKDVWGKYDLEALRRSYTKDALNAYLQIRDHHDIPLLKNPILFGQQEQLAKLKPEDVQILEIPSAQIPEGALVTTGSDKFLHEVRTYSDVPLRRHSIAKAEAAFDEALHPREPGGQPTGGQFTASGHAGGLTSDPTLAVQAQAGIAAVEKLIPEAVKTADFSKATGTWADLPKETQQRTEAYFKESRYDAVDIQAIDADLTVDVRWDLKEGATPETAQRMVDQTKAKVEAYLGQGPLDDFAKDKEVSGGKPLDFKTLSVPDPTTLTNAGYPMLDIKALRHTDGTELTAYEQGTMKSIWKAQYEHMIETEIEKVRDSDAYLEKRGDLVTAEVQKRWNQLTETGKLSLISEMIAGGHFTKDENPYGTVSARLPTHWVTGVNPDDPEGDDYERTHALALRLTEMRTDELRKERGLIEPRENPDYTITPVKGVSYNFLVKDNNGEVVGATLTHEEAIQKAMEWQEQEAKKPQVASQDLIETVWDSWKASSSGGLSLSLQLAAAREFGGVHRLSPEEIRIAEEEARSYGGIPTLQAYVRAQWDVTQTVMQKAGEDKIAVYRALMLAGERVNHTPNVLVTPAGDPVPPPTNIQVLKDTTFGDQPFKNPHPWTMRETVSFDFNGEHFTVQKKRESSPESWTDVSEAIQNQVRTAWEKSVKEVVAEHPTDPNYSYDKAMGMFDKMTEAGKMRLLMDWRQGGQIPPEPFEKTEVTVTRRLNEYTTQREQRGEIYTKLPVLSLRRAGAQSTTGDDTVANQWGGVGDSPPDPTRVVLRIEAPPTSVLSLPVYGKNIQEEHESVLVGTKDKWVWDAWRGVAPTFEVNPVRRTVQKAEMIPLVIDLQAEDRGKPHWLSGVHWHSVAKAEFNEAEHPREPGGQSTGGRDPVTGYTINDKFRAIHAYYGHAAGGYGFGPRGEYNAWVLHSQMFSPLARRALTTETLGQNSWVNFGKQNYEPDGTYKNIPPAQRPYAIQKTALLPESFAHLPGETTLKFDEAKHPRVPGGTAEGGEFAASAPVLQGVDSKANAARELARYQAVDQKRLGDRWDAATYQERLTDAEAELRSLPLIHGTTVEGALGAATNGLHSFVEMQKQSHALLEESDGLREEIDAMVPEKERGVDWSEFTYDDARHLGLESGAAQDMVDKIHELGDLETILQGKTFEADHQLGLDRFVFMTHGKKHPDYGNVAVVIDNKVIQQSWSTEKDIVRMPGSNIGNQIGSGIVQWKQYHPEAVKAYQQSIVKGDDYYRVAAARPGYLPTRDREELFELKTSSVPKSAIKGFVVYHDLDEAQRLANGLAAKGLKHKVLYVGDVGSRGLVPTGGTYAKAVPYLYHQLKTMQATGRWDEELTDKFREADAETYIL